MKSAYTREGRLFFCIISMMLFIPTLYTETRTIIDKDNDYGGVTFEKIYAPEDKMYESFEKIVHYYTGDPNDKDVFIARSTAYVSKDAIKKNKFTIVDTFYSAHDVLDKKVYYFTRESETLYSEHYYDTKGIRIKFIDVYREETTKANKALRTTTYLNADGKYSKAEILFTDEAIKTNGYNKLILYYGPDGNTVVKKEYFMGDRLFATE